MTSNLNLSPEEIRVIGCLLEKAVTTPDQYPLSLNALTNACNQKSSREPVMSLDQGTVGRTLRVLEEKHLVSSTETKSGVSKYTQRLCNTLLSSLKLSSAEYAILCLLLLRGPQTPGELRSRSPRLHTFEDNDDVKAVLLEMMERDMGPLVARLPRQAGRMDHEFSHLYGGEIESVTEEVSSAPRPSNTTHKHNQIDQLEARVSKLEQALTDLATRLGEPITLEESPEPMSSDE